jgi:DNA-binding winged helix-turn-helix (wHTH) protein/Flp pilus assembly protein TadD
MSTLHFAPFAIDTQRRTLMRDGGPVELSPRLVEILAYLASQAGDVISKDALLDRFWPDVHVTENTLTRAIADIRKAIGDNAGSPTFIQTVERRGYRFIGSVDASGRPAQPDAFVDWVKGRLSLEALNAEQLNDAITAFERVLTVTGDYAPAHAALANAYFLQYELTRAENTPDRGPLDRAIAQARRARELDPSLGEAWATLGLLLTSAGEVEQARAAARRATALEPSSWRHQFRLSVACWGEERLRAGDRTLSLMPDFAPARFVTSMVYIARQAFPAAEEITAKGAARQSLEADADDSPFPAFGLHWLRGLLQFRAGAVGAALQSFARELDEARRTSIYFREYRVNALVATGFAYLAAEDPGRAVEAFSLALESFPNNGRALLGLQQASLRTGLTADAQRLGVRVEGSIAELTKGGRGGEAAAVSAALEVARGNFTSASEILERLLEHAPWGQTGWMLPVDPALAPLRGDASFERVLARLSARAS